MERTYFTFKRAIFCSIISLCSVHTLSTQQRAADPDTYLAIKQELKNAPQKIFNFGSKKIQPADDVSFFNEKFNAWKTLLKKIDAYIKEQLSVSRSLTKKISQSNKNIFEKAQSDINEATESLYQGIINKPGEGGIKASTGRAAALMVDLLPTLEPVKNQLFDIQNDMPDTIKIKNLLSTAATVLKDASLRAIKKANEQSKNG